MALTTRNQAVQDLLAQARTLAHIAEPVLIIGEAGTGKRRLARFLHESSRRGQGPFLYMNCAAVPDSLWEAELFGQVRATPVKGKLDLARSGSLLLDEAAAMPPQVQARLLLYLETGSYYPGGSFERHTSDARLLATAIQTISSRLFRRFHSLVIPPLRERKEDLEPLTLEILDGLTTEGAAPAQLTAEAISAILLYNWPGNVRELEVALRRAVLLAGGGPIGLNHLPPEVGVRLQPAPPRQIFKRYVRSAELLLIRWALTACGGDRTKTAKFLGLSRAALYKKLKLYPEFKAEA